MPPGDPTLDPLPYHCALVAYLKAEERALWDWFAAARARADEAESLRLALLKSTYRLDAADHPALYQTAAEAKDALGLDVPLTIYQSQQPHELNAALYYIPGEAHLLLSGPLLTLLAPAEMKAVLGHELAHYLLWGRDGGEYFIADHVMQAVAADPRAERSHHQSARRYRLYTEIFCDRGALHVSGALHDVVAGLVKLETGLHQVSAASYLTQADDVFAGATPKTEGLSHPEAFIRARALRLWAERGAESERDVSAMIEGAATLDDLDLIGQVRLTDLTRRLLAQLLRPRWFQTDVVLAHARLFFDDFRAATADDATLLDDLRFTDGRLRDYVCYLLLDFAAADAELDDLPLAATLGWSQRLGLDGPFEKLVVKELGVKPRALKKLTQQAAELLQKADTPA
jgi:peptidase M48-like protein